MKNNESNTNPFAKREGVQGMKEAAQKITLLCSTYAIVLFASIIFGVIIWQGAPVLMDKGSDFLTRKPETLEVVSFDEAKKLEVEAGVLETMRKYNKELPVENVEEFDKPFIWKTFKVEQGSYIGDGYLSILERDNEGFEPRYKSRNIEGMMGFSVKKPEEGAESGDVKLQLTEETFAQLKTAGGTLPLDQAKSSEVKIENYEVPFKAGLYNVPVKTVKMLKKTKLIYVLYGNLTDKGDDELDFEMPLKIPEDQVVILSGAEKGELDSAMGDLKFGDITDKSRTEPRKDIVLTPGDYQVRLDLFNQITAQNPDAELAHQHSTDRGVIELELNGYDKALAVIEDDFKMITSHNPGLKLTGLGEETRKVKYVRFDLTKATEVQIPTTEMTVFKKGNDQLKTLKEYTHSYSAGGVAGPLMGTAFLVLFCMIIALAVGVFAAVYLNEYSRRGPLMNAIRLAMLNLAGVPSIVFGLFGLGLFVLAAPKMTDSPTLKSDVLRFKVMPSFSEPDLRDQERLKIAMVNEAKDQDAAKKLADRQGKARYYDGWTYFSCEGWGTSLLAGAFTLAIMVLPVIITSCEESLRAVPMGFREASLALGATKWQSIRTAVLPYALPGILTASVLGITRVAGETAPIMFTAAVADKSSLPGEGLKESGFGWFVEFLSQSVQALPYHIYTVAGRIPQSEYTQPMQYGSVLLFMIVVMMFAALSIWLRARMRKKFKW